MLQVNERLGDFEIVRLLGKGGMGEVYEARQLNPERHVALKVLAPWLAEDEESLERFWREASVLARLDHPSIVRIISSGKTPEGKAYYAMHLVRGISLSDMIKRGNPSPHSDELTRSLVGANTPSMHLAESADEAPPTPAPPSPSDPPMLTDYRSDRFTTLARIGIQAARALAYAHAEGFLHRDLKPSNMMVDQHGQVYLVDFGLTRALESTASSTSPGIVVGTPCFMSPEQAEGKPLDVHSDIYSLGVTLFELASQGLSPFTANREDKHAVLSQVRSGQMLPLRSLAPNVPPGLERIILKAMQLKSHKRYASAAELADELNRFLGSESRGTADSRKQAVTKARGRWPIWAGVAAVLLAIVSLAAAIVRNNRDPGVDQPPALKAETRPERSQAEPKSLRTAEPDVPIALLDANFNPIWSEGIYGKGKPTPLPAQLLLQCKQADAFCAWLLADPDCTNYEFAIDWQQMKGSMKGINDNDMGLILGWRRNADPPDHCLVLRLDQNRIGQVTLGTALLMEETANRGGRIDGPHWFDDPSWTIPVINPGKEMTHSVRVRVRKQSLQVSVDKQPFVEFTLAEIRKNAPFSADSIHTNGAVGIWSRAGFGLFRNATITVQRTE